MKLNNGIEIPQIGLGTFMLEPHDAENSVKNALEIGYRLIDTANAYVNERAVGRAIKSSSVDRKDIFLSTKLWPSEYENENAIDETLERLGVDYIDLLFLHQPAGNYIKGYKMLEKAYEQGKIKAIGISNFEGKYIDEILDICKIEPQVIQNEDVFKKLSEKYHKTKAQIILKWHIKMGFIVIPGSKNVEHIKDNFDIFDFELTTDDMNLIDSINKNKRYYIRTLEQLEHFANFKPHYESK